MTQIFSRPAAQGPATHAFVLGCGRFPKLGNAASRLSTVAGARAIVRYLIDNRDALVAPLVSIDCLLSDPDCAPGNDQLGIGTFNNDPRGNDSVDPVTKPMVETAGNEWINRCRPGDHMFFYMSTHGVAERDSTASGLLEDVGTNKYNAWGQSLNVGDLASNLPFTNAGACWVFFDACQELIDSVLAQNKGSPGVTLITSTPRQLANTKIHSLALAGARYGQTAKAPDAREAPYFTQALLRSFEACIDRNNSGGWVVTGERLLFHVPKVADAALGYTLFVEPLARFADQAWLVNVPDARIPVVIRTDNPADMALLSSIEAYDGAIMIHSTPTQTNCFLEVEPTGTLFMVTPKFPGTSNYRPGSFRADPCAQIVKLVP